jgi:hypothetical protein
MKPTPVSRRTFFTTALAGSAASQIPLHAAETQPGQFNEPARDIPLAEDADVIVCGGGPAGVTAAITAARAGAKVRLFEWRDRLIRTIGESSRAHLLVATILPQKAPRPGWQKVDAYNAPLPALVAAQKAAGKRITLVHMHAAITTDDLLADDVHPNKTGMDKMAATWFAALKVSMAKKH